MARSGSDHTLIRTVLLPLAEIGSALRPALDERQMVLTMRRAGVTLAKKTISRREVDRLLARGFIRREAPPSCQCVITFRGEAAVRALQVESGALNPSIAIEERQDAMTGELRIINSKESPLAWLARRKNAEGKPQIDALQFAAGERLRSDFTIAGLTPRMTLDWTRYGAGTTSGIGHPGLATDVMMAARQRLHAALDVLGPELAGLTLDLCCFLKGIGDVERARGLRQRSAKYRLMVALDRLVAHYGLGAFGPEHGQGILSWMEP